MKPELGNIFKLIADDYGFDNNSKPLPPVNSWNPQHCGDIGMEIRRDGSWWHEGVRISREKLVVLFSRILRRDDDGKSYLVTPYEKVIIHIEDAHFIIIRADRVLGENGFDIILTTNVGDVFKIDECHKIWVEFNKAKEPNGDKEPRPYVMVRDNLFALINRAVFYELIGWSQEINGDFVLESGGNKFNLGTYMDE